MYFEEKRGQCLVGVLSAVGGLHLILTAPQPVLNFLPSFSFTIMGREVGAQQLVGAGLLVSGACVLRNCM
jgi:hypothetical protein|tara:strand:- start:1978 stop:2187 length:210 start_codon:yes stop_codon:yes gene_type:complete